MSTPSDSPRPRLRPDTLWTETVRATRHALATGALQPIATDRRVLDDGGVPFQVRVLGRAHLKDARKREPPRGAPGGAPFNPFATPDPDLVVGELTPTHVCLLNKFNVVEHHLLIVTRGFEEQESLLTAADFEALALAMAGLDGLAFYNSGETAGASQRHKHLQLIQPLGPDGLRAPVERLLPALPPGAVTAEPALGFAHALTGLRLRDVPPAEAGARLLEAYEALRAALGLGEPPSPYNLLATRDWMLLVPRARAEAQGINVNAMGFAGSLLVKSDEQFQRLEALGPMALLGQVAPGRTPTTPG